MLRKKLRMKPLKYAWHFRALSVLCVCVCVSLSLSHTHTHTHTGVEGGGATYVALFLVLLHLKIVSARALSV